MNTRFARTTLAGFENITRGMQCFGLDLSSAGLLLSLLARLPGGCGAAGGTIAMIELDAMIRCGVIVILIAVTGRILKVFENHGG